MNILDTIDRAASTRLSRRTDAAVKAMQANGEGLELKKATLDAGRMDMVMMGPGVFALAEEAAAILDHRNAKNFVEVDLMPRIDRGKHPVRLTIQWANGMSPAAMVRVLRKVLNEVEWIEIDDDLYCPCCRNPYYGGHEDDGHKPGCELFAALRMVPQ